MEQDDEPPPDTAALSAASRALPWWKYKNKKYRMTVRRSLYLLMPVTPHRQLGKHTAAEPQLQPAAQHTSGKLGQLSTALHCYIAKKLRHFASTRRQKLLRFQF